MQSGTVDEFTEKELIEALRRSGKDTAPVPDRIQYSDIKNITEEDRAEHYTTEKALTKVS